MHIACDADHGERIAAIGGELEFDLGIVKTCVLTDIDAHRRIIGQDPNTIVIFVDAEFARRTEHAHRNHTAQLALFDAEVAGEHGTDRSAGDFDAGTDIRCAADDLQRFAGTGIDFADVQMVRILMIAAREHLTHYDAGKGRRNGTNLFNLKTRHRQGIGQLIRAERRIDILAQPFFSENHLCLGGLVELTQEAKVAFKEKTQIVDAVAKHRQAFKAGAERKTDVFLGIQAVIAHHIGMHFTGARNLEPLALSRSAGEHHVDFDRRFSEREVGRTEADYEIIRLKEAAQEVAVHALQIGKTDIGIEPQAFDLMEHGRMRRVAVNAIGTARTNDLDRRLMRTGVAHLHGRGVRTQRQRAAFVIIAVHIKRILH